MSRINHKRQLLLCTLALWLLFSWTTAVRWTFQPMLFDAEPFVVWGWFDSDDLKVLSEWSKGQTPYGEVLYETSALRLALLGGPGVVLTVALWFVLRD